MGRDLGRGVRAVSHSSATSASASTIDTPDTPVPWGRKLSVGEKLWRSGRSKVRLVQTKFKSYKAQGVKKLEEKKEDLKETLRPFVPHRSQAETPCERGKVWKELFHPPAHSDLLQRRQVYQAWCKEIEDAKPPSDPSKKIIKVANNLEFLKTTNLPDGDIPTAKKLSHWPKKVRLYSREEWPCYEHITHAVSQVTGCLRGMTKFLQNSLVKMSKGQVSSQKALLDRLQAGQDAHP
ncbi:unnamed protein product [Cladocopium goreaui]|uniref:Uncharacterized protein n=1 Tax=Cladocopium goreaui TaxID=2562237 RepID=A0A9P1FTQ2_9DINO|nr:unnamed protein product [Cladocopium goreaui]